MILLFKIAEKNEQKLVTCQEIRRFKVDFLC